MYLILRISEAESDPEKYCQRLREEFRTLSWPCQNLQLSEILVGNWREGLCVSDLVNRLVAPERLGSCNPVLLGAEETKFILFLIESHRIPKSGMRSFVSNFTIHKWESKS